MKEICCNNDAQPVKKKMKPDYTDDYKKLISLMVGCQYVSFHTQTWVSFQSKSDRNSKKNVETLNKILNEATQVEEFPDKPVELGELPNKPLGDIKRKGSKLTYQLARNY